MVLVIGFAVLLAVWLWALFDCATTPSSQMNHLSKPLWLAVVVLFWWVGALAWLWLGRSQGRSRSESWRTLQTTPRASRPVKRSRTPMGPDDDPEFLSRL
jgi:Phospholipase_D-nuclease N-terminal